MFEMRINIGFWSTKKLYFPSNFFDDMGRIMTNKRKGNRMGDSRK